MELSDNVNRKFSASDGSVGGSRKVSGSVEPENVVDLETAITKTGFGLFNWTMVILAFPGSVVGLSCNSTMTFVISAANELHLSSSDKAMLLSAPFAGMVISNYFWGIISDEVGRKNLLAVGFLLDYVINICSVTTMSVPLLAFFKFLSGLIVVGPYTIFWVYLSEVFSHNRRDLIAQLSGVYTAIGSILQAGLAMWLIPHNMPNWMPITSWQLFILLCGMPSVVVGIASIFFFESPKFLVDKRKYREAHRVCSLIYSINSGKSPNSYPVKEILSIRNDTYEKKWRARIMEAASLFQKPFLTKAIISMIFFAILFGNQNMMRIWTPEIFTLLQNSKEIWHINMCPLLIGGHNERSVTPKESVYSKLVIIHAIVSCSHVLYLTVVCFIRKKIVIMGNIVVGSLLIASVPHIPAAWMTYVAAVYISLCETACYAFLGSVVRLFPTHLRAQSYSLTMTMGRLGVIIGNTVLSNLIYSNCESIFYIMMASGICSFILLCILDFTPYDDSRLQR